MSDPVSDPAKSGSPNSSPTTLAEQDDSLNDHNSEHRDKYNDPRAQVTARGVWIGVGVVVLAAIGAAGSIYARKTRLEETRRFWGDATITALQLGERIELLPRGDVDFEKVELTAMPGLGHLRRALLDERNYQWKSEADREALADCSAEETSADNGDEDNGDKLDAADSGEEPSPVCIQLRLSDPTAGRFEPVQIDIDLGNGWVGPSGQSKSVQLDPRMQVKLNNFFSTIINYETRRYDERE